MKKELLFICFLSIAISTMAQEFVVSGRVTDAQTGEILSDVNIVDKKEGVGVTSNAYGLYSIRVKRGICFLQCSMLGYKTCVDTLNVRGNKSVDFMLQPDNYQLEQVEIEGMRMHSGQFRLEQKDVQAIPVAGGEPDLLKALQYLPGVAAGNEGANNLSIRGSDQWGNLVLLDEAVVYNPNHALSFFSVFNNDAIQKVNLYKSYFPPVYGGRSSAVIDVRMKEGNSKERRGSGTVGVIASKAMLEGPFKDGKGSYLISGRIAYPGAVVSLLEPSRLSGTQMTFYDLNAKLNRVVSERDRIYFSVYNGGDYTVFEHLVKGYGMSWGNATATLRWNRVINEKIYANCSAIFSNYYYRYRSLSDGLRYLWKSNMQSYQLKCDTEYAHANTLRVKSGSAIHLFSTMPGSVEKYGDMSNVVPYRMERRKMLDVALYGEAQWIFWSAFQLDAGIRLSALCTSAGMLYKSHTFFLAEPRAELSLRLDRNSKLSISFNQASQNLHMLSNSSVGLPSDMWVPVNSILKPVTMRQMSLGYERSLWDKRCLFSLEGYYRKSDGIIDYKDNVDLFLNNRIEEQVLTGKSSGYGVECSFAKNSGSVTGRISYTYSRSYNRIVGVEGGKRYPSVLDRPHNLKLFLNYAINRKWDLSSTFSYCSGMNLTLPIGQYQYESYIYYIYSSRNGYRAPAFHQWDLSCAYHWRKGDISLSVVNVYNRKNTFSMYASKDGTKHSQICMMYLYGIVPSISYSFKF
ncbi:TonB-dependent receptor [Bacteroides sp.]